jgi:hypothetical protein
MLAETALSLLLSCPGSSSGMGVASSTNVIGSNNYGERVNVSGSTRTPMTVEGVVEIRISNGLAEVMIPAQFTLGSGGTKWRKVKNLSVTDDEISGKISLGLLDSSTFRIDRRSGVLISNGGFRGQCQKVDESKRAF